MSQRCDGMPNCPDASDEADCPVSECNSQQYHCKATGRCIPLYWKCDGYADCVGGDDEAECATGKWIKFGVSNVCPSITFES